MKTESILCLASLACALLGATGCSTEAWYAGMKHRAENECNQQPFGEREACLARVNKMPHDAYEKERAAAKP